MADAATSLQQLIDQNMAARQLIVRNAVDMWQSVYTNVFTTGVGTVVNVPLRNVGLVKRLLVRINATIDPGAQTQTLTGSTIAGFGPSNFFSNITLWDLANQQRVNTAGWHVYAVSTAKRRRPYGSAMTTDTPFGYKTAYNQGATNTGAAVEYAAASLTGGGGAVTGALQFILEIPVSYSDMDLRGAIYANVNNANFYLQLTVNPNMFIASTGDPTLAVYKSAAGNTGVLSSFTVEVQQNYLDQLPRTQQGQVILPTLDLSTAYLLNNTSVSGVVANQDNPIPYANFREFMGTTLVFDNAGTLNPGTDIGYFAIQSANFTNVVKYLQQYNALFSRLTFGTDNPQGMYYFDHRHKPINTRQYGNMELIVNPTTVSGATAAFLVGWESLAMINQLTGAGSLFGT